jgi:hypothetical protein
VPEVLLAAVLEDVVLAGNVEHLTGLGALERLGDRVEGAGLLSVGYVARVDEELGRGRQRVDTRDGFAERGHRLRVGRALEADVRVADLREAEAPGRRRLGGLAEPG